MAPTSNLNVTLGCAMTVWVYYHVQGVKEQGVVAYLKHFAVPPGSPVAMAPLMLIIEVISHLARVMSLCRCGCSATSSAKSWSSSFSPA